MQLEFELGSDTRGVSEVVGAILVFGILIALLSIIQTQAVPAQNQEIEFQHTLEVQGDLITYHQSASEVASSGDEQSVAIKAGTNYPSRLLLYNPPPVQGSLGTSESNTVTIGNVRSEGEVDDYVTVDASNELNLDSRTLEYQASYNELIDDPLIRYEYGILYSNFSLNDGTTVQNQGTIIDGTNINLIFLAGDYSQTSAAEQSVGVQPVSAPARNVPIENTSGDDLFIELPSNLPESKWEELYNTSNVKEITKPSSDTVRIELNGTKEYSLRMSRIGLDKDIEEPDGYYIVPAGDATTSVDQGGTTNVRYEVRDRYNNPVDDVEVEVESPTGTTTTKTTNSDGQLTIEVTPNSPGTQTATAYIQNQSNVDGCDSTPNSAKDERCKADFTLQVTDLSINPGSGVRLIDATIESANIEFFGISTPFITNTEVIQTEFESTGGNRNIKELRINLFSTNADNEAPVNATMTNPRAGNDETAISPIDIGGPFYDSSDSEWKNDPDTITSSGVEYNFAFLNEDGSPRAVENSDFFVLTVVYENDERAIYFISPDN